MNINLTGHGIDLTNALREHVKEKFSKIERHSSHITKMHVVLSTENKRQTAEVTLHIPNGKDVHASTTTEDLYASINDLAAKVERILRKSKEKALDAHRRSGDKASEFVEESDE